MGFAPECRLWVRPATSRLLTALAASLLASVPAAVAAQTAPGVLPPTREEVTRPDTEVRRDQALRLEVEGGLERAPCALDNPEFRDIRFTVRGAEFEGLREVRPEELAHSYAPLVGSEQVVHHHHAESHDLVGDSLLRNHDRGDIAGVAKDRQNTSCRTMGIGSRLCALRARDRRVEG